jgi:hypothetical protein
VYFEIIGYIFRHFGMLCQENSGKPWLSPSASQGSVLFNFLTWENVAETALKFSRHLPKRKKKTTLKIVDFSKSKLCSSVTRLGEMSPLGQNSSTKIVLRYIQQR